MKAVIKEYGESIMAVISALLILSILTSSFTGPESPVSQAVRVFAGSICGG